MNRSVNRVVSATSIAVALIGISAAALFSASASAGAPAPLPSKVVRYDDLNLAEGRNAAILYTRIKTAAAQVCGEEYTPGGHFVSTAWKLCVATAVDAGVRKVDWPALSAYHAARTAAPTLIRVAARE